MEIPGSNWTSKPSSRAFSQASSSSGVSGTRSGRTPPVPEKDTVRLEEIEISQAMLEEARANEHIQILGEPHDWPFDEEGNLW